jgi:hypothetical protein
MIRIGGVMRKTLLYVVLCAIVPFSVGSAQAVPSICEGLLDKVYDQYEGVTKEAKHFDWRVMSSFNMTEHGTVVDENGNEVSGSGEYGPASADFRKIKRSRHKSERFKQVASLYKEGKIEDREYFNAVKELVANEDVLELLGQCLGGFKYEVTGSTSGPFVFTLLKYPKEGDPTNSIVSALVLDNLSLLDETYLAKDAIVGLYSGISQKMELVDKSKPGLVIVRIPNYKPIQCVIEPRLSGGNKDILLDYGYGSFELGVIQAFRKGVFFPSVTVFDSKNGVILKTSGTFTEHSRAFPEWSRTRKIGSESELGDITISIYLEADEWDDHPYPTPRTGSISISKNELTDAYNKGTYIMKTANLVFASHYNVTFTWYIGFKTTQ